MAHWPFGLQRPFDDLGSLQLCQDLRYNNKEEEEEGKETTIMRSSSFITANHAMPYHDDGR